MIALLFLLYVGFALLDKSNPADYWKWVFGIIGL
jgi:hypothetical protein